MKHQPEQLLPEALSQAASGLRGQDHIPPAHVELFEKVSRAQWRARQAIDGQVYPPVAPEAAAEMLKHEFFLLDFARLRLEPAGLRRLALELAGILAGLGELDAAQEGRLRAALEAGRLPLAELLGAVFRGQHAEVGLLARRVRVPRRVLSWLAVLMLRPYLSAAAESLAGHVAHLKDGQHFWPQGYCPVCGHEPLMAITLRPNGRRQVECALCTTRWEVRRGRCALCGNDDGKALRFFYYDLESPYRVDVCDKCRCYIKAVDERKKPEGWEAVLPAEDVATLYLDALARRKRYQPPGMAVPGGKASAKSKSEEVMAT